MSDSPRRPPTHALRPRLAALALAAMLAVGPAAAGQPEGPAPAEAASQEISFEIPFSTLLTMGQGGKIARIDYKRRMETAEAVTSEGMRVSSKTPTYQSWIGDMAKAGVTVTVLDDHSMGFFEYLQAAFAVIFPLSLIIVMVFAVRQMGGAGFGKAGSKAKRKPAKDGVTFADVAGAEEAKRELMETVSFLKDPARFKAVGARTPCGILLVGDPGNGKTLLAKAVAGEAGVPFHFCTGSDFAEMYIGLGARRVRGLFKEASRKTPSILFIDEIDAVGRRRGGGNGGAGEREHDQTLNALLTEMQGLGTKLGVVVIAATNRMDVLDPALLRPGRFDRHIQVSAPGLAAREDILRVHSRKVPLGPDVDLARVARGTTGFSGADLGALVNEAALEAAREGATEVSARHVETARDRKLLGGAERTEAPLHAEEIEIVAYHEAGHALAAVLQEECDPIHTATIVPRGRALGFVARFPERDRVLVRRSKMMADLVVTMAGRAAEEARFGKDAVTAGAGADIEAATRLVRDMVSTHGLGSALSNRAPGSFDVSEGTRRMVDEEVEAMIREAYVAAQAMMAERAGALDALAGALKEHETLDGDAIRAIVAGHGPAAPRLQAVAA